MLTLNVASSRAFAASAALDHVPEPLSRPLRHFLRSTPSKINADTLHRRGATAQGVVEWVSANALGGLMCNAGTIGHWFCTAQRAENMQRTEFGCDFLFRRRMGPSWRLEAARTAIVLLIVIRGNIHIWSTFCAALQGWHGKTHMLAWSCVLPAALRLAPAAPSRTIEGHGARSRQHGRWALAGRQRRRQWRQARGWSAGRRRHPPPLTSCRCCSPA